MPAFSINTPYFFETSRLAKSLRNGTVMSFSFANCACDGVLSVLIPKTLVSVSLNFAIPAWYALNSVVQPPVKAAG
jgi:hypothetical protein